MNAELWIRIGTALALAGLGYGLYHLVNRTILQRARYNAPDLPDFQPGRPAVLYFTTPDCAPCRTVQRPALRRVQDRLGDRLQLIEVNAYDQPDLASRWGVLSVPTTFVIDANGKPCFVNHGVTTTEKLIEEVEKSISNQ